jgi:predicted dehydrogenase
LVAVADAFDYRIEEGLGNLSKQFSGQIDVPPERRFTGLDAYRQAIECLDSEGVVMLATPPVFRPLHLEYAVERGCHVFMEKSFAVDAPGIRRVLRAGERASEKNLKIAGGLMSRHYPPLEQAVEEIHRGALGEVITCWAYREHDPVGFKPRRAGDTEMAHQIRNYSNFTWLNGSFLLDWLIHNIDVCCWVKNSWPVSAQGQGGRQVRTEPDQLFDHFAVEYSFEDGTRLFAQGRHMSHCWGFFGDVIHGATGSAVLGEGIPDPLLYRGHRRIPENVVWRFEGPKLSPYQVEQNRFFQAIRQDRPYNETERSAYAAMAGILGRMAAESGREVTWEEAMASDLVLAPGLEAYTMTSNPPVLPDARGLYPIAKPGFTRAL